MNKSTLKEKIKELWNRRQSLVLWTMDALHLYMFIAVGVVEWRWGRLRVR